jgi:Rrf2 family protein
MKLSRTAEYAIQAILQLAEHNGEAPVPCSRLASVGQMPERFLLQILRTLVTHGMLSSTRGVEGGYTLARPVDQVSLLEVIEAIDGPLGNEPTPTKGLSAHTERRLKETIEHVTRTTRRELANIKLGDLLPKP